MYFQAAKLLLFSQISKKKWKKHRKLFRRFFGEQKGQDKID